MLESSIAEWDELCGIKAKVLSEQSAAHGIHNPDLYVIKVLIYYYGCM